MDFPALAIRSNIGIELWGSNGCIGRYESMDLPREATKNSRCISFSPDGRFFAYTNEKEVKVLRTANWQLQCSIPRAKSFYLEFSPKGNYLSTWELYVVNKEKLHGTPNMFVYELDTGAQVFEIVQKKQTEWKPSWSTDESIFALVVGGEALFYNLAEGATGFKTPIRRIGGSRGGVLSLAPGNSPPFLAFYTPAAKSSPGMCKLYKYPALSQNQAVSCKTLFQADRIEMMWNKRGSGLLLLTSTEVDKSGSSYYGNQAVHFMNTKGDSCSVPLAKEGPVHCVKWSPKGTEFMVVYGLMPSKAAIYNLKCDVVFDFGEGPRNCAFFNEFGNLVVLAGFGNLPGNIEIWDTKKKEKLSDIKVSDTTYFEWNPNGKYFVTATTAPRLRIGNGFKIFHYSGALIHETIWPEGQELLEIKWQQFPENAFNEPEITKTKHEGIKSSQPEASKKAYTPPHLRLIKEGKDPGKLLPQPVPISGMTTGSVKTKNNKKDGSSNKILNTHKLTDGRTTVDMMHCKKPLETGENDGPGTTTESSVTRQKHHTKNTVSSHGNSKEGLKLEGGNKLSRVLDFSESENDNVSIKVASVVKNKNSNTDKEKKIRNVAKKLSDIKKLKARQDLGESLELNQMKKISQEAKFLEELKTLKLS